MNYLMKYRVRIKDSKRFVKREEHGNRETLIRTARVLKRDPYYKEVDVFTPKGKKVEISKKAPRSMSQDNLFGVPKFKPFRF